jgi:hypothetical protein
VVPSLSEDVHSLDKDTHLGVLLPVDCSTVNPEN